MGLFGETPMSVPVSYGNNWAEVLADALFLRRE